MLAHDIRTDVDRVWDTIWSTGVTNPIVVSDLIGTLLMAGASPGRWEQLRRSAADNSAELIARELAEVRRSFGVDPGSEIEAAEFWLANHALAEAMDLIDPVIEAHGDILGDIYEHILSKLSLAGHFGQFRTPRHIVEFMVEALDPNDGEVVADPSCGSGGFLVAASDYRRRQGRNGPEFGIEIDRTISRIALANVVFHGMTSGTILHGDGLTTKMPFAPDVILANPPFAGAVSADVSRRFASGSNKTELLFVEAISETLADNGRAAVVVPSGVITGGNGSARYVRKRLLEMNTLEAVVELPSGVFRPYTDVRTAILFWRNVRPRAGATVKMIRLTADGFSLDARRTPTAESDLPEALCALRGDPSELAAEVDPAEIAANGYNLNPSRYLLVRDDVLDRDLPTVSEALGFLKESVGEISSKLARIEELIS